MTAVFRNNNFFCSKCGKSQELKLPMSTRDFVSASSKFEEDHESCEQTWEQKYPPQDASFEDRKKFWLEEGEHGTSSMCIFMHLTGQLNKEQQGNNYPLDPDDFHRCYQLLKMVPQFKEDLNKMAELGLEWKNLVENWEELTRLLEEQIQTKQANGMYQLMKKLIQNK